MLMFYDPERVWSFSQLTSFEMCPLGFYLHYVEGCPQKDKFFTQYGTFNHRIHEMCEKDKIHTSPKTAYIMGYGRSVTAKDIGKKMSTNYYESGKEYWEGYKNPPGILCVEKDVNYSVFNYKFKGVIDLLFEENGKLILCDHKSADIKPRSKRGRTTLKDIELDRKLRQLYLYSIAVHDMYGKYPDILRFNCFRVGTAVDEEFSEERFEEAKVWAKDTIEKIQKEETWEPSYNVWQCKHICGVSQDCELYNFIFQKE